MSNPDIRAEEIEALIEFWDSLQFVDKLRAIRELYNESDIRRGEE